MDGLELRRMMFDVVVGKAVDAAHGVVQRRMISGCRPCAFPQVGVDAGQWHRGCHRRGRALVRVHGTNLRDRSVPVRHPASRVSTVPPEFNDGPHEGKGIG